MNYTKFILSGLFACSVLSSAPITLANDPVAQTWQQWWSERAITVNPYSIYQQITAHPIGAMISSGLSVALGIMFYVRYHRNCDWRAQKYKEIYNGVQADLNGTTLSGTTKKYEMSLKNAATNDLKDKKLARLINEFYETIGSESDDDRGPVLAKPEDKAREIELYLFGGNGNYTI